MLGSKPIHPNQTGSCLTHSALGRFHTFCRNLNFCLCVHLQGGFFYWSALKMTKCQTLREFWHLRLFRWDLLCNLTLDQSKKPPCKRNKWRKKLDNKNYRAQNRRLRGPSLQRTRARKMKEERLRSDQGPVRRELTRWVCVCFLFLCLFVGFYVCCLLFVCTYVCWDPTRELTR